MAIRDANRTWKTAMSIYILGCILYLIGFSNTHWYEVKSESVSVNFGLFKLCVSSIEGTLCAYLTDTPMEDWMKAGLALACLGLIVYPAGAAVALYAMEKTNRNYMFAGSGLGFLAGLTGIVTSCVVLISARNYNHYGIDFSVGWSAIVYLIACILTIISAVMQILQIFTPSLLTGENTHLLKH